MTRSRRRCCGAEWAMQLSPIPRSTVSCSFSSTASPSRSSGGRSRRAQWQPFGAGSPRGTMCSASGRHSCPAPRRPASWGSCTARSAGVPAFRWYDRELGRVLIANRPDDAAIIEQRATTGAGLLADDGLAIGNLFTGDAPRAVLTMSRLGAGRGSALARQTFAWFLTNPNGFTRGVVRTVAEVAKERWQAARQDRLNILPRVHRGWIFAGLRAATNVLQRDLNTAVVAEEMRKGTKSIYVDYVDYDEIAHHAGMFRPESLAALDGLDRVLGTLERLATRAARRYHIVVALRPRPVPGPDIPRPLRRRPGRGLYRAHEGGSGLPRRTVETWGRVESLAEDLSGSGTHRPSRPARRIRQQPTPRPGRRRPYGRVSVLGSGNLGLLYVHSKVRLTLEDLHATLAQSHSRPIRARGHRLHRRPGLLGCPVGARCRRPGAARYRRGDRSRPRSCRTATTQPGCSGERS